MGIQKIVVLAREWQPYYKDEFRRAARLARELCMAVESIYEDEDPRFAVSKKDLNVPDPELYTENPYEQDEFDPQTIDEIHDDSTSV